MKFWTNLLVAIAVAAFAAAPLTAANETETANASTTAAEAKEVTVDQRVVSADGVLVARLSNGMTVIVRPVRHLPVVHVRAGVYTGGMYEGKWLGTGISHLTEHLVAKGAVHDMGPGPAASEAKQTTGRVDDIGGQSNAATSMAMTYYYISAAAGKTMDCIDLVADWMARPDITKEDFEREHGVVQRELEMGKDNPSRQLWYAHSSSIFRNHPAAVPVIGYARPLSKLTYQDILDYHSLAYVPQNMVFVVVGDVDSEKVLARVRQAMRGFDKGRDFSHQLPAVEEMLGVRRVVETNPNIKEVTAEIAFQTIPLAHEDLYALDVLSYVLSQGRSSRLVESLQRDKKLVTSISSSSWTPDWGKGVFNVSYRAEPAKADAAEDAIIAELKRVVDEGVSADELRRAKRQKQADFVYSQQSVESIASTLVSDYFSTGNVGFSRQYTSRIQEVTAEQVQQAARKYFTFDKMAVTRLEPRSEDAATAEVAVEEAKAEAPEATLIKLDNGLRVILQPVAGAGLVSMAYVSEGGLLLEDDSTNGLGSLMTVLSTRGAGDYSAEDIARFFDEAGGSVAGNTGNNSFYWQATVLEDSAAKALEIFAEIVQNPTFSEKELEIVRPLALAAIERQDEQLMSQLMRFHRGKFFSTSPYSMMPAGQKDVVSQATTQQLAAWHHKVMRAGSGVLAVYGSFDADKLAEQVSELFGDARKLPEGHIEMPEIDAPTVAEGGERFVLETDNESAAITVAVPGTSVTNLEDRFAIDVLDTIISGYRLPSGWLHRELRGRQLVYVVHAYNWLGLAPGAFMTYAIGQPENMPTIAEIIQRNLRKAADYEPTQKEIDRAVNTILTAELLGDQSISSLAIGSALDELYGLGYDFRSRLEEHYRAVKPADVLRVGRKYLSGPYAVTITTPTPENVTGSDAPVNEDQETTE